MKKRHNALVQEAQNNTDAESITKLEPVFSFTTEVIMGTIRILKDP